MTLRVLSSPEHELAETVESASCISGKIRIPEKKNIKKAHPISNQSGLTLFELLIVLAIIGLFALVATPPISKAISVSRIKTTELELENLDTALGLFSSANHNTYPDKLTTLLSEGFLTSSEGLKDQFGIYYNYAQSADKNSYSLFSSGSDKKSGTGDDLYSKNSIKPGAE